MKKIKLHITTLIAAILLSPMLFATGNPADNEPSPENFREEMIIDKVNTSFNLELRLEDWMLKASEFVTGEMFLEEELVLEGWMTETFDTSTEILESEMMLENWMTEEFTIEALEMDMSLEPWMLAPFTREKEFQEDELVLENWMLKF